jgi:large-conductance mechanosensitive channel
MDDTPRHFVQELRSSILKKRAGQIALAVILAEACLRFLNGLTWFLIVPTIGALLNGHTESVLFQTRFAFPWQQLLGSGLDFAVALIFVFYLNRWIHHTPGEDEFTLSAPDPLGEPKLETPPLKAQTGTPGEVLYSLVGERLSPEGDDTPRG